LVYTAGRGNDPCPIFIYAKGENMKRTVFIVFMMLVVAASLSAQTETSAPVGKIRTLIRLRRIHIIWPVSIPMVATKSG
jgi:hypothetical protein